MQVCFCCRLGMVRLSTDHRHESGNLGAFQHRSQAQVRAPRCCHAGIMACPQQYTSAGFELQIGRPRHSSPLGTSLLRACWVSLRFDADAALDTEHFEYLCIDCALPFEGTNHFGHFALVQHLLPHLEAQVTFKPAMQNVHGQCAGKQVLDEVLEPHQRATMNLMCKHSSLLLHDSKCHMPGLACARALSSRADCLVWLKLAVI